MCKLNKEQSIAASSEEEEFMMPLGKSKIDPHQQNGLVRYCT